MSEITPGSWQPDPFGRYAQRYWDGVDWTNKVIDASGARTTDPPVSWVPSTTSASKRGPQPAALVLGFTGALLVILSVFVLNWFEFRSSEKEQLRTANDFEVKAVLGLSVSEITDGLKFTEIKTLSETTDSSSLSGTTEQYFNFGYLVAVGLAAGGVLVMFTSGPQKALVVLALLAVAAWHATAVNELGDASVDTQFGAWIGAVGLVMVAAALLVPRRRPPAFAA